MSTLPPYFHLLIFLLLPFLFSLLPGPLHTTAQEACSGRYIRNVGGDSLVCVCNSKGCPPLLPPHPPAPSPTTATATTYTTSRGGERFTEGTVEVVRDPSSSSSDSSSSRDGATVVEVAVNSPKQVMNGFGGSFTDSAAITMSSLSAPTLDALLRAYFSPEGLEYSLIRVPIGGADFSLHPYTYADTPSVGEALNFALADEDVRYKLPLLRRALGLGRRSPRVMASPWSAPAWMKTNGKINETGELLEEMWHPWTEYLLKFIKEYESASVPIWAITTQNHGFDVGPAKWNSMCWSPENLREWIKTSLGPGLHEAGLKHVKVYTGDDNRDTMNRSRQVLSDPGAARYITGVAVHWYMDLQFGPQVLEETHLLYPDKDILYTEACTVPREVTGHVAVVLGSWERAEMYAWNIIEDVNHYASGWIDWNLCLDLAGGPNWAGNVVDAPVIINQERDEFYLQPMFFIMGHFSKFVPPGSVALHSWVRDWRRGQVQQDRLHTAAFVHPDGNIVLQLLNKDDAEVEVRVEWGRGTYLHTLLPPRAFQTLLLPWKDQRDHEKKKYHSSEEL